MKYGPGFILLCLLVLISCRERASLFDPQSENFTFPPPICLAWPSAGWYTQDGYLIGVRMQVDFIDPFTHTLPINNILYQDISPLLEAGVSVHSGMDSYTVDLINESPLVVGDYSIKIYYAEIPIGGCIFEVVPYGNTLIIKGVSSYDTLFAE